MKLDERKIRILQAIIDDYILSASPVGSRTISHKYYGNLSSATIRNEMSDLKDMGYLDQPHTSAGRIPSEKAYRLYVDELMSSATLMPDELELVRRHFDRRVHQVEEVLRSAAQVISDLTQYAAIVVAPQVSILRIRHVQLVPVGEKAALLVIVTDAGIVKDSIIVVPEQLDAEHLHMISRMLTLRLAGVTLGDAREEIRHYAVQLVSDRSLLEGMLDALSGGDEHIKDVVVGGTSNLLKYPEYADIEKARSFLAVFEDKERIIALIKQASQLEFTVRIGSENTLPEMQDCSLVIATYRVGSDTIGRLGVIGPTRMQYSKVLAVLRVMGDALSDALGK